MRNSIDFWGDRRRSLINLGVTLAEQEHRSRDLIIPGKANNISDKANVIVEGHLMSIRDKKKGKHNHHKLNDASKFFS